MALRIIHHGRRIGRWTMTTMPQPFHDFERMIERLSRQFEEQASTWGIDPDIESWGDDFGAMRVDLERNTDAYIVTADLPGYDRSDVSVRIDGRTLHIAAEHDESTAEGEHDVLRRERRQRSMSRMLRLPEDVEADGTTARLRNGVLTVTLPRAEFTDGTDIEVT